MKIILSRKGFDSAAGRCASPIFPNDRIYSLPIPYEEASQKKFCDIGVEAGLQRSDVGTVVENLTSGGVRRDSLAHLDPDIHESAIPRMPGWKPAFGQADSAQSHLAKHKIGPGDVFVFFGWFSRVTQRPDGRWIRVRGAPDLHVIFGWLQIAEVVDVGRLGSKAVLARYPWLRDHPHVNVPVDSSWRTNVVYIGADRLRLDGKSDAELRGAGVFQSLRPRQVLTKPDATGRSIWKLPKWFKGSSALPWLSYHEKPSRWTDSGDGVELQTVGRGQEFVLDCRDRPQVVPWLTELIQQGSAEAVNSKYR